MHNVSGVNMVPDTPDVEAVLFGKDGVAEGVKKGSIVVDIRAPSLPYLPRNSPKSSRLRK